MEQDDKDFATSRTKQRLLTGDEGLLQRNRTHWFNAIAALTGVLKSGQAYSQIYAQLSELDKKSMGGGEREPGCHLHRILARAGLSCLHAGDETPDSFQRHPDRA